MGAVAGRTIRGYELPSGLFVAAGEGGPLVRGNLNNLVTQGYYPNNQGIGTETFENFTWQQKTWENRPETCTTMEGVYIESAAIRVLNAITVAPKWPGTGADPWNGGAIPWKVAVHGFLAFVPAIQPFGELGEPASPLLRFRNRQDQGDGIAEGVVRSESFPYLPEGGEAFIAFVAGPKGSGEGTLPLQRYTVENYLNHREKEGGHLEAGLPQGPLLPSSPGVRAWHTIPVKRFQGETTIYTIVKEKEGKIEKITPWYSESTGSMQPIGNYQLQRNDYIYQSFGPTTSAYRVPLAEPIPGFRLGEEVTEPGWLVWGYNSPAGMYPLEKTTRQSTHPSTGQPNMAEFQGNYSGLGKMRTGRQTAGLVVL